MKGIILAAGEGTRLFPLTQQLPKALVPVNGVPLLGYILPWLSSYGVNEVAINLYHLADQVTEYCGDGGQFDVELRFSTEKHLLGTAGGVKNIGDWLNDTFIVAYGDILTDLDLAHMVACHKQRGVIATLALSYASDIRDKGVVNVNSEGLITSIIEKPKGTYKTAGWANGGIYVFEPAVLKYIPKNRPADFAMEIFPLLLEAGVSLYGYQVSDNVNLIDIGTWDGYEEAQEKVASGVFHWR